MHSAHRSRSLFVLLVLALLLAAPWPVDAKPSESPRTEGTTNPIHLYIGWLAGLWGDNACTMDLEGGAYPESLDEACGWDPNGACRESPDTIGTWDPNGG